MPDAIIQTLSTQIGADKTTVEVEAQLIEGALQTGMAVEIELNRSTAVGFPITKLVALGNQRFQLALDGEGEAGAVLLDALDFVDELLFVRAAK